MRLSWRKLLGAQETIDGDKNGIRKTLLFGQILQQFFRSIQIQRRHVGSPRRLQRRFLRLQINWRKRDLWTDRLQRECVIAGFEDQSFLATGLQQKEHACAIRRTKAKLLKRAALFFVHHDTNVAQRLSTKLQSSDGAILADSGLRTSEQTADKDQMGTARSLLPISAARRPPAIEACLLPCSSCDYLFPSKSFHPLNFLLVFLPRSLLQGGAVGFSVVGIAAEPQATKPQSCSVARSMS